MSIGKPQERLLYANHMPTTPLQKIILSGVSAVSVFANPNRADMLANLGELTGTSALRSIHAQMCSNSTGVQILYDRPRIRSDAINKSALRSLPSDTFGYAYARFMDSNGFEADGRSYVQFVDDTDLAYVMQRYRELHDLWHTLFGLPATLFGEIVLKYIELVQTGLPACALSGFVGQFLLSRDDMRELACVYVPWAYRAGKEASFLMNIYYEKEFSTPLEEFRDRYNIQVAPPKEK
ncbi:hypothetical protein ABG067_004275 [Albugo candida]|nr:unnamed protein product [Albugo candida]|eukprot:CCI45058.1 unnamed protein product [Albugo candida]